MELKDKFIIKDIGEVVGFNGLTSSLCGQVRLDITMNNKVILIYFYLMNYCAPHNRLWGFDRTGKMGVLSLTAYKCLKFPKGEMIYQIRSNQW